jgi:hypothetical protein
VTKSASLFRAIEGPMGKEEDVQAKIAKHTAQVLCVTYFAIFACL